MGKLFLEMIKQILNGQVELAEKTCKTIEALYVKELQSQKQKSEFKQEHDAKPIIEAKLNAEEKQPSVEELFKSQIRKYVADNIFELFKADMSPAIATANFTAVENVLKKFIRCISELNQFKDGKCKYFFMSVDSFFQLKSFLNRGVDSYSDTYVPPLANSALLSSSKPKNLLERFVNWFDRGSQQELIKLLVQYGADVNIQFVVGAHRYSILTRLIEYYKYRPEELADRLEFFLKELKAKLDVRSSDTPTDQPYLSRLPIAVCAEFGLLAPVKKMIEYKSEVRGVDKFGGSVLHAVLGFKGYFSQPSEKVQQFKLINYLVEFDKELLILPTTGGPPSAQGMIPLYCAVKDYDIPAEIVACLLDLHIKHPELAIDQRSKECIMEWVVRRISDAMVKDKLQWCDIFFKLREFFGVPIFSPALEAYCNSSAADSYIDTLVLTLGREIKGARDEFYRKLSAKMSEVVFLPKGLQTIVCSYVLPFPGVTIRAPLEANWGELETKEVTESKRDTQSVKVLIASAAQPNSGSPISSGLGLGGTSVPQNGSDLAAESLVPSLSLDNSPPGNRA